MGGEATCWSIFWVRHYTRNHRPPPPFYLSKPDEREKARANVFKPSHALPTMTVEQFGELEAAAARERAAVEQAQQRAEQERLAGLASDDEDEDDRVKHKVWYSSRDRAL